MMEHFFSDEEESKFIKKGNKYVNIKDIPHIHDASTANRLSTLLEKYEKPKQVISMHDKNKMLELFSLNK